MLDAQVREVGDDRRQPEILRGVHPCDAVGLQLPAVRVGDDATDDDGRVDGVLAQPPDRLGHEFEVRSGQDRQPDDVHVLFPEILKLLAERGGEDILVVAGGIIPEKDIAPLKALGIREIFLPGTPTQELVDYIRQAASAKLART